MNRQDCVVISNDNKNCSIQECIEAISSAGFKNVFVQWYDKDFEVPQLEQVKMARDAGLNIIFAHLGYQNINDIWLDNEIGESLVERYINDLRDVAALNIPMVIMHLSSKFDNPSPNNIGLDRIKRIVKVAEELKIKIAFENTKTLSQVYYVLNNIKSDYVGLCFDCGHWHCNNKDNWSPADFKGRVFAVHLHDNDGSKDQHLLPFDGNIDWLKVLQMLKDCDYDGPLTMELCYRNDYLKISPKQFYEIGYKRYQVLDLLQVTI